MPRTVYELVGVGFQDVARAKVPCDSQAISIRALIRPVLCFDQCARFSAA